MTDSKTTPATPPVVLVFAASDPSSGAGIQADLLTIASLGCHPLTVITALTVQDTLGVESVHPIDAELVEAQARTILEDVPVAAFKVGVLGSIENVVKVAEIVADYPDVPLVLDPVLASGRGDTLSNEGMLNAMRELLLPQTTVLTPNTLEARQLCQADEGEGIYVDDEDLEDEPVSEDDEDDDYLPGELAPRETEHLSAHPQLLEETDPIEPEDELARYAGELMALGAQHVLITGTHAHTTEVSNRLYGEDGLMQTLNWPRLPGSYHGSGCTLASALAAGLAFGAGLEEASQEAQEYTWQTLEKGYRPGMGQFIPDRLFWARSEEGAAATSAQSDADAAN